MKKLLVILASFLLAFSFFAPPANASTARVGTSFTVVTVENEHLRFTQLRPGVASAPIKKISLGQCQYPRWCQWSGYAYDGTVYVYHIPTVLSMPGDCFVMDTATKGGNQGRSFFNNSDNTVRVFDWGAPGSPACSTEGWYRNHARGNYTTCSGSDWCNRISSIRPLV